MSCSRSSFMSSSRIPMPPQASLRPAWRPPPRSNRSSARRSGSGTGSSRSPTARPSTSRSRRPSASARRPRSGCASRAPGHTPEELARVAFKKHVRLARLEGGALGVGRRDHGGARHRRAAVDPEPHGLLHRRRLRLRPAPPDAPGRVPRAPGPLRHPRRGARGARRRGQAHGAWRWPSSALSSPQLRRAPSALAKYIAQAPGAPLRRQADPVHRRADRRDSERQRDEAARASARCSYYARP